VSCNLVGFSPYVCENDETSWVKIKNKRYSQIAGRGELLERMDRKRQEARLCRTKSQSAKALAGSVATCPAANTCGV